LLPISLFAVAVSAHGVHQSATLAGKWKVKSVSVPISGPEAEKAKAMMMPATLEFAKDKSFSMMLVRPMKGTWKVTGREVALTITDMMGTKMSEIVAMARSNYANDPSPRHKAVLDELSKPMIAVLSSDGKTLTFKPAAGKAVLVFMKA
jgi:hypothetical protein